MEKTILESVLEEHLLKLGMPLGKRIYADDRDSLAEIGYFLNYLYLLFV